MKEITGRSLDLPQLPPEELREVFSDAREFTLPWDEQSIVSAARCIKSREPNYYVWGFAFAGERCE